MALAAEIPTHREYDKFKTKWVQLKACLEGEEAVKKEGETYLPYPVPVSENIRLTKDFTNQYELYKEGAHFVEFTSEAVEDLVSAAFRRPLRVEPDLPEDLKYLDLEDLGKETVATVGGYGRAFVFVDYPTVEGPTTLRTDITNRAYVSIYEPLDVLDWAESRQSGKSELVRVLLREIDEEKSKEYGSDTYMYRELYIEDSVFKIKLMREEEEDKIIIPRANGAQFTEIPGMFVGTTSNTAKVDKSPVIGISNSNIKHYRTWADLNHIQTYVGNPQLILAGLPAGWNKHMKDDNVDVKVKLDAATALALEGPEANAKLLEINTNSLVHFRTLELLEQSMAEQGAKIKSISKKAGVESADALKVRSSAAMSKLAAIVINTEEALKKITEWVGMYMGVTPSSLITINKEFYSPEPDGTLLSKISEAEKGGTAPRGATISYMKQVELLDERKTIEEYLKEVMTPTDTNSATSSEGAQSQG